jgi:hypothetical protein
VILGLVFDVTVIVFEVTPCPGLGEKVTTISSDLPG